MNLLIDYGACSLKRYIIDQLLDFFQRPLNCIELASQIVVSTALVTNRHLGNLTQNLVDHVVVGDDVVELPRYGTMNGVTTDLS